MTREAIAALMIESRCLISLERSVTLPRISPLCSRQKLCVASAASTESGCQPNVE